jgi:hypothetical protein
MEAPIKLHTSVNVSYFSQILIDFRSLSLSSDFLNARKISFLKSGYFLGSYDAKRYPNIADQSFASLSKLEHASLNVSILFHSGFDSSKS